MSTVQQYCTRLLRDAIENARRGDEIAEAEAKRGAFVGFHAITEDPEYLAEWSASATSRERAEIHVIEAPDYTSQILPTVSLLSRAAHAASATPLHNAFYSRVPMWPCGTRMLSRSGTFQPWLCVPDRQ